jgi:two-component system, NtrC family, nitrogen regulation sensor histidine kinase NtrY
VSLQARFVLWFALAALVSIGATAFLAFSSVSRAYQSEFDRRLEAAHADAQREYDALRSRVDIAVAGLATRESPLVGGVLLELEKQGELSAEQRRTLKQVAPQTMKALGLDVLLVVGGDGTILAAPHDPSRIDERLERSVLPPHVTYEDIVSGGRVERILVVEATKRLTDRGQKVTVIGGKKLDAAFLAPLRRDGVEARILTGSGEVIASTTSSWSQLEGAPQQPLLIDFEDKPVARIVVAVSDAQLRRQIEDLVVRTAGLAAVALAGAALLGWIIARRLASRLDALVSGAQAVARGDLEHRVTMRGSDEVATLAAAFNVMTSELTESRQRLQNAERVAAWQEIAQRLAHEIKNPLTPIQMSVETMRKTQAAKHSKFDEIFLESTATILEEVQRLKRIVSEFSQFARMPTAHKRALDLNEVVTGALSLYRGAVPVTEALASALPPIEADRDQLTQVILNLLENARDAASGTITVRTEQRGSHVLLEVEDDGPGFDAATRDKLFTPYFTTKPSGNGLGLSIVWRIVVDHGGRISAVSAPGSGARFSILLPVSST